MASGKDPGIEPEARGFVEVSFSGQNRASSGQNASNSGHSHRLATSRDVEERTAAGQNLSSSGHALAPKSPQSSPPDLARVIDAWPRLPEEKRDEILRLLR